MENNGLPRGVSSSTQPGVLEKGINGFFYHGTSYLGMSSDLVKEPFGISKTAFPLSFSFINHSSVQDKEALIDFAYEPTVYTDRNESTWAVVRSPNRVDAYDINDLLEFGAVFNPEDKAEYFRGWKDATENPHAIEYVKRPKRSEGLLEFAEEKPEYDPTMTRVNKFIKKTIPYGEMINNEVGNELSKLENERQRFYNFLFYNNIADRPPYDPEIGYHHFNPDTLDFHQRLVEEGIDIERDLQAFGRGNLTHEHALAATYFRAFLVVDNNLYQSLFKQAKSSGFSDKDAREFAIKRYNSVMEHESYHFHEEPQPEKISETIISDIQSDRYKKQAKQRQSRIDAFISQLESDYADDYRSGKIGRFKIRDMIKEYLSEAEYSEEYVEDAISRLEENPKAKRNHESELESRIKDEDTRIDYDTEPNQESHDTENHYRGNSIDDVVEEQGDVAEDA